jgi:lantibiotic biosynthesis protein
MAVAAPELASRASRRDRLYTPLDWLFVRAPVLPVEAYLAMEDTLRTAAEDPRVRAALAVGARDLLEAVDRTRDDPRVQRKLQRYLIRMATRPTPYGLFAGVALAETGDVTDLELSQHGPRTRTRPDMGWLTGLVARLEERPEVRQALRYRANTAALIEGGRVLLAERADAGDEGRPGPPVSIRATATVRRVLELARDWRPWEALAAELLSAPGATPEKVDALLAELWRQTLLLSELRPPLTAASPARYVAARLASVPAAAEEAAALDALLAEMAAWDALPGARKADRHRALVDRARALHAPASGDELQVDAALPLAGRHVNAAVAEEAARAAELLMRLSPAAAGSALSGYARAFQARYGDEREVPLLELLDPERGLGPPSHRDWGTPTDADRAARRDSLLWQIAVEAVRDRTPELELDDGLVEALRLATAPPEALPLSLDVAALVMAESAEAIDAGDFRLLVGPNLGAQAAGRNLGRFADLLGDEGERALAAAARVEERCDPGRLGVEVVYMPARARSANVVIRPAVRDHEIVLGATPGVAAGRVVPLDELLVGLGPRGFRVRWPRVGAELRLHAGHMLNAAAAPTVCRFLDDVARDGIVQLTVFDWGSAGRLPYLPRVRSGRVILEPARWRVDEVARDRELSCATLEAFEAALPSWRAAWRVPRRVYLAVGDNRLLIDLEDREQSQQLYEELRRIERAGPVVLQEALPDPGSAWLPGPGGRYVTELVVPLVLSSPARETATASGGNRSATVRPARAATSAERLRPPGSDWLFLKLYGSRAAEEDIIAGPLRSLAQYVTAAGLVTEWFFLRYGDPDPHLRLRFRGDPATLLRRTLPELCTWADELLAEGRCARFAFDTYEREVERYGGDDATAVSESVFAADSVAVAEILQLALGGATGLDRTELAALTIDDLLAALGLAEPARIAWYREAVTARHESGDEHRRRGAELRRLLGDPSHLGARDEAGAVRRVLAARRGALAEPAAALAALAERGKLERPLEELCRSYVHLHCNRLLGSGPPSEGMVLGLLLRTRESLSRAPVANRIARRRAP